MYIQSILRWNNPAKTVIGIVGTASTAALISGIVLMILKGNSSLSMGLTFGGGSILALTITYSLIAGCSKRGHLPSSSTTTQKEISWLEKNGKKYLGIDAQKFQNFMKPEERADFARYIFYKSMLLIVSAGFDDPPSMIANTPSLTANQLRESLGFTENAMDLFLKELSSENLFSDTTKKVGLYKIESKIIELCKRWGMKENEAITILPPPEVFTIHKRSTFIK